MKKAVRFGMYFEDSSRIFWGGIERKRSIKSDSRLLFPLGYKWHREVKASSSFLLLIILSGVLSVLQTFLKHQLLVFLMFPFSIPLFSALVCFSLLLLILGLIYSFSSFSRWKHRLLIWDISFQDKHVML